MEGVVKCHCWWLHILSGMLGVFGITKFRVLLRWLSMVQGGGLAGRGDQVLCIVLELFGSRVTRLFW